MKIHPLPQPLNGSEQVTIRQLQNGNLVECTMLLNQLSSILSNTSWVQTMPTIKPTTAGILWNNGGTVCVS